MVTPPSPKARPGPRVLAASLAILAVTTANAQSLYDRHVIFENSPSPGDYYHSDSRVVAPSRLAQNAGRFPVSTDRFASPPNSLRLQWFSAPGGDWRMTLQVPTRYGRKFDYLGDTLSFQCFSEFEITEANSPRIYLLDSASLGSPSVTLVKGDARIEPGKWVEVRLPFAQTLATATGTSDVVMELRKLVSLTFTQGLDDPRERTLYVDDFRIVDSTAADAVPPGAPSAIEVHGRERHFDVSWSPGNMSADVLAYRIHRSTDDRNFTPIATQPAIWTRFADFFGAPGQEAFYKVSAIDIAGNESPLSAGAGGRTRPYTDEELLDLVQEACFRYYWEAGHPRAGLAPEILPGDEHLIATGGNGFGIMALLVATERGFVTRDQSVERMRKIVRFLAQADRFRGVWPHFLDGRTGKAIPFFGKYDGGGDLVETSFVIQGLLAARQYYTADTAAEREIREVITTLWHEVEWDWYRQTPDSDVLSWHWSPDYAFHINHPLIGWNETMIIYLLAIASPTHPVPASLYHTGWAGQSERHVRYRQGWGRTSDGDHYTNGNTYHGMKLDVGVGNGGELFFTHFSFMGFDPRGIRDRYTNYFLNNRNIVLINRAYCIENPLGFAGYGPDCWGRSAGINSGGGRALPRDDNGTINCMAALASMPYTPDESMAALRHFYRNFGPRVWGVYGFHDGFNESQNWFDEVYMALNQAPIVVMIENHRTGLVWNRFMSNPEIAPALEAIGFARDERSHP